jgi:hypothetical protein
LQVTLLQLLCLYLFSWDSADFNTNLLQNRNWSRRGIGGVDISAGFPVFFEDPAGDAPPRNTLALTFGFLFFESVGI